MPQRSLQKVQKNETLIIVLRLKLYYIGCITKFRDTKWFYDWGMHTYVMDRITICSFPEVLSRTCDQGYITKDRIDHNEGSLCTVSRYIFEKKLMTRLNEPNWLIILVKQSQERTKIFMTLKIVFKRWLLISSKTYYLIHKSIISISLPN